MATADEVKDKTTRTPQSSASAVNGIHQLKWIPWKTTSFMPVVTQNENGPCPLLALCNVLILKGIITLTPGETMVTSQQLIDLLGSCLVNYKPKTLVSVEQFNYEQNMQDAITIFPRLLTGLDVNVRFNSVSGFEFTQELAIFDLLDVPLYHGWLSEPSDAVTHPVVSECTYNQLVEMAINDITSEDSVKVNAAYVAQQFLEQTASQLTYHGLYELNHAIKEGELCVFFRNNHFNTLLKRKGVLYILVTDYGFLNEFGHVWQALVDVDDSGDFYGANFTRSSSAVDVSGPSTSNPPLTTKDNPSVPQSNDRDIEIAIGTFISEPDQQEDCITDEELAMKLQQQEIDSAQRQRTPEASQAPPTRPHPTTREDYERIAQEEHRRKRKNESVNSLLNK